MSLLALTLIIILAVPLYFILFPNSLGGLFSAQHARDVHGLINHTVAVTAADKDAIRVNKAREELLKAVNDPKGQKESDSTMTLEKRLKYAQWKIPTLTYRLLEAVCSIAMLILIQNHVGIVLQAASLLFGPVFMGWILNFFMMKRFKRFDADYPHFLMSMVALLKAGMMQIGALESAAKGLEAKSLVREEVEIMVERLRLGLPEDKSIGAFGEDIYHPEIELFVQAMLLSRKVGGNLSDTLERLARQVRKNQFFRNSAIAAVGLQRGSIWVILGLLVALEGYIYMIHPTMVVDAWHDELGWKVWQASILMVIVGFLWVRQITKIKV
jgi:tight adherence protein B